ncbi:hypothetical protein MXL46_09200 [Heyndrickxia sporothermodurans]|uniref:hypothetical protein n=1 Tax=Heyndrickxia sporothermodurans TaxID=46224 RepID=UPI002DBF4280|nr:hypothetical protein [Heyndrickxia sporothermodurans]MEB6549269.1 hypothetical protein [Heyndrickxia sporothermodurans]
MKGMNIVQRLFGGRKKRQKEPEREQPTNMELFRLYTVLTNHDDWWNAKDCEPPERRRKNLEAKAALHSYYKQLVKVGTSKKVDKEATELYKKNMKDIEIALQDEKYMRACYEIINLMYYEPFMRKDIHSELRSLLERNLGVT